MSVGIEAIDKLKLDEAFAQGTYRPFNDCWTVRMDKELLIVDDDELKYSRFSDCPEEGSKALMVINENNKQIIPFYKVTQSPKRITRQSNCILPYS